MYNNTCIKRLCGVMVLHAPKSKNSIDGHQSLVRGHIISMPQFRGRPSIYLHLSFLKVDLSKTLKELYHLLNYIYMIIYHILVIGKKERKDCL